MIALFISTCLLVTKIIAVLVLTYNLVKYSFAEAEGDEIITLERRWIGRHMPEDRTIAFHNEIGVQARTLGPGIHFLIPFAYKVSKHKFVVIGAEEIGIVTAFAGNSTSPKQFFANPVECNYFQDGEAFLKNGGQKGVQLNILPPGKYRINPKLFSVEIEKIIVISEHKIGVIEALAGAPVTTGRIFAAAVECDNFQDAEAFFLNGGQKGLQLPVLAPGVYRINTHLFKVEEKDQTIIPGGHIGLITAADGESIPEGRLLARKVTGHANFENADAFINSGGEKGRQIDVLMPGTYRINSELFQVSEPHPLVNISTELIGIVNILDGRTIMEPGQIAAEQVPLELHNNFQDPASFLAANGQKGLQVSVLRSGSYCINPWFAQINLYPMTDIAIGECGVVTSYVGEEGECITDSDHNVKIVKKGQKGIWAEPLGPGKHAINTMVCKVEKVPTTQILICWGEETDNRHKVDYSLRPLSLRSADAFNVIMSVNVIIHIAIHNAPTVIATLGSVENMITNVLEPAISSYFRNAAQVLSALDFYTRRAEIEKNAKEHIKNLLRNYNIESKDTMIADVILPEQLIKTVTDRQIAEQERITYAIQKQAQDERRVLENAKAQADMQTEVVRSEYGVEIAKNHADCTVKEAEGEAKATRLRADADAEATKLSGHAQAEVLLAQGRSNAEVYDLQATAIGKDALTQIKVIEQLANNNMKLVPNILITNGGGHDQHSSGIDGLMGLYMLEKLSGKDVIPGVKRTRKAGFENSLNDLVHKNAVTSIKTDLSNNITDPSKLRNDVSPVNL